MDFNEKEFKKMVRKANVKQTSIGVFMTLLILIFIIGVISLPMLNHYNYISFGNKEIPKVKGLPDESIRSLDMSEGYLGLLFDQSGGFEINKNVKEMNVYVDYYVKGELQQHDLIYGALADENEMEFNGVFYWGISNEGKKLSSSFTSTNGTKTKGGDYDLSGLKLSEWTGATFTNPDGLVKNIPDKYLLLKYVKNEKGMVSSYSDQLEEFKENRIKENDELMLFYVEFK